MPSSSLRSEEHTSELQSLRHLVCRLLLEKKNNNSRHRTERPSAIGHRRNRGTRPPAAAAVLACVFDPSRASRGRFCLLSFFFKCTGPPGFSPFPPPRPFPG